MQLEIGQIYDGVVRNITQYGAFVDVAAEDGKRLSGMVHISEVADAFVRDIHDYLHENDKVRVKVISINPQGKVSMSIKQAAEQTEMQKSRPDQKEKQKPRIYEPKRSIPQSEMSFEDKLLHFKQTSEEKICDLKRGSERRSGSRSRKS
ncbi:MAG: S1 RNA-binding domain-containing protein [Oscillospiraceae bacterium]|nr:S1 RNA-binding domain-containing protein [Oscillospiraceae bacterium]